MNVRIFAVSLVLVFVNTFVGGQTSTTEESSNAERAARAEYSIGEIRIEHKEGSNWHRVLALPAHPSVPVRDPGAIEFLDKAVALFGADRGSLSASILITGSAQQVDDQGTPSTGSFIWRDFLLGTTHEFRRELNLGNTSRVIVSGHGKPAYSADGKAIALPNQVRHTQKPLHLPYLVWVSALSDSSQSVRLLADSNANMIHIRIADESNPTLAIISATDWYFDGTTHLPLFVEFPIPKTRNLLLFSVSRLEFGNFQRTSGVLVPMNLLARGLNGLVTQFKVSSVDLSAPQVPAGFELPTGGVQ
jgi:hypothetical protein